MEQEETSCDEVETVSEFTHLYDRVSAGRGCGWFKIRECDELLYGRRFPLMLKGAVYRRYVRSAILCRSEALCLMESEMRLI